MCASSCFLVNLYMLCMVGDVWCSLVVVCVGYLCVCKLADFFWPASSSQEQNASQAPMEQAPNNQVCNWCGVCCAVSV